MRSRKLNLLPLVLYLIHKGQVTGQGLLDDAWEDSVIDHKREHSLSQPYWGYGWMVANWDFYGSTVVTNDYIRLTPAKKSQEGGIWNSVPVEMRNWEVKLHFKIHGPGSDLSGDGLAFWYTKDRMTQGPVFGSKDRWSGLAVIIDTYKNNDDAHIYPHLSVLINNGSLYYDHDGDGTAIEAGGCHVRVRDMNSATWILIRYENDVLTVSTDLNGSETWAYCAKIEGLVLPTNYYFGLTSATGDLFDNHDVLAAMTSEILSEPKGSGVVTDLKARALLHPFVLIKDHMNDDIEEYHVDGGSWIKKFILIVGALLGLAAIGLFLFTAYELYTKRTKQKKYYDLDA